MRSAAISATLPKIDTRRLFSLGYCDSLSFSDCAHGVRGNALLLGDVLNLGVRFS
jgi:hypothetical protein